MVSVKENDKRSQPFDDTSNTSSIHLHDIEMTNVDENRGVRSEDDTMEGGDTDRSIDQPSAMEDPFDQLRHASNDEEPTVDDDEERNKQTEIPAENTTTTAERDNNDCDNVIVPAAVDNYDEFKQVEEKGEKEIVKDSEQTRQSIASGVTASTACEEATSSSIVVTTNEENIYQEPLIQDDLQGGENEHICLLPDDERAISNEQQQRAIQHVEHEPTMTECEKNDTAPTSSSTITANEEPGGQEGETEEEDEEEDADNEKETERQQIHQTTAAEVVDDIPTKNRVREHDVATEAESNSSSKQVKNSSSMATTEVSFPSCSKDNQIRELASLVESETCFQCNKTQTPCLYTLMCDNSTNNDGIPAASAQQPMQQHYICSFDCVQTMRTENPGKFELIQRKVTIVPIFESQESCVRCGELTMCKFRYRQEQGNYDYLCDSKCVEHLTAINRDKYSLVRKRYTIVESATLSPNDVTDKRCIQCGDTKPCQYAFNQGDDGEQQLSVCADCLALFMTEHPDLFRLHRRRSVRVRNFPKDSASTTTLASTTTSASSGDVERKFTARTEEEAEAARIEREASFLRRCHECHKPLQILSKRWLQWETMEFCDEKCLGTYQTANGSHCVQCRHLVSVNSMGKFCVRFGVNICQFCSASCLEKYKKILKSCSYCLENISPRDKGYELRVGRVGELGVLKDFCSALCHQTYQSCLNPTLKYKRRICAVCNHEKMTAVVVHLEGRPHYFCSTPCFSAFKFVNNVNPDECAMCGDFFERKSLEAYTIYQQGESAQLEPLAFCTKMCLNLYISTSRQIVPCNWCKVKKYTFDMILRPSSMLRHCSLHCLTLCEVSCSVKLLSCNHCNQVRTPQYELNMTDSSLRMFCTYQCLMKFQSQFNNKSKSTPLSSGESATTGAAPVPMGIPKRIPRATTTATITAVATNASAPLPNALRTESVTDAGGGGVSLTTASNNAALPPNSPRLRGRPPKTTTVAAATVSNTGTGSNLPVIASVHSLAAAVGSRGTRAATMRSSAASLNQKNWPELRVALEPLPNIPASGRILLSSILPPPPPPTQSASPVSRSEAPALAPLSCSSIATNPASSPPPPPVKVETHTQIVTIPPTPVQVANASTMCKPMQLTKSVSCRPIQCNVECQTENWLQRKLVIPIPVPIYVPVPMFMYSMPTPVPVPIPLPIPVPVFIPTTRNSSAGIMKEIKKIQDKMPSDPYEAELLMMAEMVAGDKKKEQSDSDSDDPGAGIDEQHQYAATGTRSREGAAVVVVGADGMQSNASFSQDLVQMALKMASNDFTESQVDLESAMQANTISQQQQHHVYTDLQQQQHHHMQQQHQLLLLDSQPRLGGSGSSTAAALVQRGRKRGTTNAIAGQRGVGVVAGLNNNNPPSNNITANKRIKREQTNEAVASPSEPPALEPLEKPDANMCLKYTFGVNAWKQWVLTKNADLEKSSIRRKPFKSDILQLTADELNYSLCLFVNEVRKPNGTEYAPDTIYYLVLGIQQYLFENSRVENIFTDPYYERFTDCLDEVAKKFSMLYNDSQFIVTRVEEEHLWECKQLGAHSPHVLLSTLMFFNTKHFNLVSVEEHMELSFSHIMKHWKRTPPQGSKATATRNVLLRFYPPQSSLAANARKKKVYEQLENEEDPLRCPVKLYEFYLSKCPESVKTRNDVFYLQPERSCVPDSPVWYSTQPLSKESLTKMLHRVKMVKEINIALLTS
ncbi:zinc finger MYM-type protein 4 [Anopheles nili]|uniref:zinc finger MYM-type protein 4 n=1 Tax=Anopheles nili TaxID=185578 RepID=UPI00237B490C|nr:zinc finger MYM-type protein 4 [Anopheles nili]